MSNLFSKTMSERSTEALIAIVSVNRNDYMPEEVAAAIEELKQRNVDVSEVVSLQNDKDSTTEQKSKAADDIPMNIGMKVLTLLLPYILNGVINKIVGAITGMRFPVLAGFPLTIILLFAGYITLRSNGYKVVAKDYLKWIGISYATMVGLFLLEIVLVKMRG